MNINPQEKMCVPGKKMEKWILREAFKSTIPDSILWRQKEQFSDGVGHGWIHSLKTFAEQSISDVEFRNASITYPIKTPLTKEGFLYRKIFEGHFPNLSAVNLIPAGPTIACSTPTAIKWDASFQNNADPSGRSVKGVYQEN
jgi:asparagine synthase (glutamine-hydrolysing)